VDVPAGEGAAEGGAVGADAVAEQQQAAAAVAARRLRERPPPFHIAYDLWLFISALFMSLLPAWRAPEPLPPRVLARLRRGLPFPGEEGSVEALRQFEMEAVATAEAARVEVPEAAAGSEMGSSV